MANKTVYPYGTDGELPASIGLINDLVTGGADNALAAQQGVVLKEMIENPQTEIDVASMGGFYGVITSSDVWSSSKSHQTAQIPVKPGQVYRLVANANTASYYAFFKSISFWSSGGTPDYSSSQSGRVSVAAGTTVEFTIPSDTNYLYVALYNSSTNQTPQHLYLLQSPKEKAEADLDDRTADIVGTSSEYCDYANDTFSGTSNIVVTKVGQTGYLIRNKSKVSNNYALYSLPSTLVEGNTYWLTFEYTSWLSAAWYMAIVDEANGPTVNDTRRSIAIPATGQGKIRFKFTYYNGDSKLRLASNSQNSGTSVLIENLSIKRADPSVVSLAQIVESIDKYAYGVPQGGTYYPYNGRKIELAEHSFSYGRGMSMSSHQSSAMYGDYIFAFTDKMASVYMYNKKTEALLYTFTQTALDSLHHCNQAFFGTEFYDADDPFPLVYITVNNDGTTAGGYCEAYRIIPTMGTTDYSSFTMTLVQTITLPVMTAQNALGNANFVLDTKSGYLYTYSRNNTSTDSNYLQCRITKWRMPKLSQGNVTYTDADILDSWETDTSAANMQGAAIRNNYLFIFRGYSSAGYIQLHVFDLYRRERVALMDLMSAGFTMEPEGVWFDGDVLCTTKEYVYKFWFK